MFQVVPQDVAPLIERADMPQIHPKDYGSLVVFLAVKGVTISAGYIDPKVLKLHQEVDVEKALGIPAPLLLMPVLVSSDSFVLDGDHRTYRHWVMGTQVPYIQLYQPFDEAFKTLFDFIRR